MRVFFSNLGCKLNQAELERLAREFTAAGHSVAPSLAAADLHVVNTCTVTHVAARDSRKLARRGRRVNPALKTVLTGCYVASDPEAARALAGVDLVVPNADKERLLDRVHRAFPDTAPRALGVDGLLEFGNSRALVKVEDGCNMRCAFCIIPATRGAQRSRPLDEIVAEVSRLVDGGFQEVVVTGVQISSYRWREQGLYELVTALLDRTAAPRLRLTSIAPWQFDERLLGLFDSGRLCRHFHLSLQSGSAATLRRMRRPYSPARFAALVGDIRRTVPGVALTTDLIVGFPGETPEEFEEGLRFAAEMEFARIHAFPYSSRPGTEAATLPAQVPHEVKRRRMARVLEVAERSRRRFAESQLGRRARVLWERRDAAGWRGTSDHYLKVVCDAAEDLAGRLTEVRLASLTAEGVRAAAPDEPGPPPAGLGAMPVLAASP